MKMKAAFYKEKENFTIGEGQKIEPAKGEVRLDVDFAGPARLMLRSICMHESILLVDEDWMGR